MRGHEYLNNAVRTKLSEMPDKLSRMPEYSTGRFGNTHDIKYNPNSRSHAILYINIYSVPSNDTYSLRVTSLHSTRTNISCKYLLIALPTSPKSKWFEHLIPTPLTTLKVVQILHLIYLLTYLLSSSGSKP